MKIIKKGEAKDVWNMQVQCTGKGNAMGNAKAKVIPCGSIMEIGYKDIFVTNRESFDDLINDYYTVKCIECGALTDLPGTELTEDARTYAHENKTQKAGKLSKSIIGKISAVKEMFK